MSFDANATNFSQEQTKYSLFYFFFQLSKNAQKTFTQVSAKSLRRLLSKSLAGLCTFLSWNPAHITGNFCLHADSQEKFFLLIHYHFLVQWHNSKQSLELFVYEKDQHFWSLHDNGPILGSQVLWVKNLEDIGHSYNLQTSVLLYALCPHNGTSPIISYLM